ncbi:N-6 DNA methylase [Diplocloster hominis]|uniref:N-6 DNA methylase n=1 Tax=Diplocloster hominis TaxID=3079010 RepID=UPI0031BA670A
MNQQGTFDYQECFKNIYYYLYSNGNSSRAERIVSDITKVLLCKLMLETKYEQDIEKLEVKELLKSLKETYPSAFDQFDDFAMTDEDLKTVLTMLSNISLSNAPSHIMGDAFQAIIGPTIRGDKGQFFTPKSLVKCMIKIIDPKDGEVIMDPACGTGGFLTESFVYQYSNNKKKKCNSTYIGIDKDKDMSDLSMAVTEIITCGRAKVYNQNSLEILCDNKKNSNLLGNVDVILTNPPFGSKIGITDKSLLEKYEFGYSWAYSDKDKTWYKMSNIVKSQDPQILFVELCVKLLKDGGRMAIVLPEGVFGNKSQGYIWAFLKEYGNIVAMIDCPRNTFQPSTDTKTNVLIFEKKNKRINKVKIAVAKNCGHDRRGRITNSNNEPLPDDFILIGDEYRKKESKWWKKVNLRGMYFVPRYFENEVILSQYKESEKFISIGEMVEKGYLNIHSGHEVGSEAYGTGNVPFIRTSDLINFELASDPTNSVSEEIYEQYSKQQRLKEGDILFIADGRYRIGKTAILCKYNIKCIIQSHIDIFSLSEEAPIKPYEFVYLINSQIVQEQIRNLVFIQSTLGTLGNRIKEIQIPLPVRDEEWNKKIHVFQENIETRAKILSQLNEIQHSYEL